MTGHWIVSSCVVHLTIACTLISNLLQNSVLAQEDPILITCLATADDDYR